jgi:hypothetical protein
MSTPPVAAHTAALLTRLASTGLPVGDARKPPAGGWQGAPGQSVFRSYLVLYPLPSQRGGPDAALSDRWSAPRLHYQVTCVGEDRRAAETASDLAAARLLNSEPLDVPGRSTVLLAHESSAGVQRDEDTNPPLYFCADRYRLDTSPT